MSTNNADLLKRAITAVTVRQVIEKFGRAADVPSRDGTKFCSVLRPDKHPSCSIENEKYHDWTRGEHRDSYDLYQQLSGLDSKGAFTPFVQLAGLGSELTINGNHQHNGKRSVINFDWKELVEAVNNHQLEQLADWRGYSIEFCQWLRASQNIGWTGQDWAFPFLNNGKVVAAHIRYDKRTWQYKPNLKDLGLHAAPLIVGDLTTAARIIITESQWDGLAALDDLGIHRGQPVALVSTRGASNGRLVSGLFKGTLRSEVVVIPQNDLPKEDGKTPSEDWLEAVRANIGVPFKIVRAPKEYEDLNRWHQDCGDIGAAVQQASIETPVDEGKPSRESNSEKQSWPDVEGEIAASLRSALGQVRCVGDEWFVCSSGVWYPRDRDEFRPRALELLPKQFKTHRNTIETLKRLESEQQVTHSGFFGAAKFNAEGFPLISVQNGTLCITPKGVRTLATDPDQGFTTALPIAYERAAQCPLFNRVLREAVPEEADRELFLDVISTALIPDCRFEVGLVVIGEAGTGKSTAMAPIPSIFGSACSSLSMSDLCHPNGYKLSLLRHTMINLATELNTLELDDSGLFKQLISGEQFTARPIYGRPFEMRSTAKLIFLANSLPRFKSGTDAEVRRLRFVRFDRKVSNPDVTLKEAVALEAPGLFAELVRRASELLAGRKLSEPSQWGTNTADRFSISNDPVGQFVRRFCKLVPSLSCDKDALLEEFRKFRDGHGISDKFDDVAFFRTLYDRFPAVQQRKIRSEVGRRRVISGIDLNEDE
jgi:P4 family phage/plasmid primase-like protien